MEINGQAALISGGGSGLGRATALELAVGVRRTVLAKGRHKIAQPQPRRGT